MLDNNTFTVKTFEDMRETKLSIYTNDEKSEFRPSDIKEVQRFLHTEISKLKRSLIDLDDKKYQTTSDLDKFTQILGNLQ